MSIQSALNFIHYAMNDDKGKIAIHELYVDGGLEQAVKLGRNSGFDFSTDELRQAFTIDWKMRAKYYSKPLG